MKYFWILILVCYLCPYIKSQSTFKQGYIITVDYDTINGLIDYRGDIRNSNVCTFKKDTFTDIIEYYPFDIHSYRFINSKYYVSKIVSINGVEKSIFLECLVDGIANLYYYRDINSRSDHYLIEKDDGKLYELTNQKEIKYINGKKYLQNSNKYLGLLLAIYGDCEEIRPQLSKASLNHKSLITITQNYHDYVCHDQECIVYEKQLPPVQFNISPFISGNIIKLSFLNDPTYKLIDFKNDFYPSLGVLLSITSPLLNEKISFDISTEIGKNQFYEYYKISESSVNEINSLLLELLLLRNNLSLKYIYPKGKLKPTVFIGGTNYVVFNKESYYLNEIKNLRTITINETSDVPINRTIFGGFIGTGLIYSPSNSLKLFLNLSYSINSGISQTNSKISLRTISINAGTIF
jgi:hypothetical protein